MKRRCSPMSRLDLLATRSAPSRSPRLRSGSLSRIATDEEHDGVWRSIAKRLGREGDGANPQSQSPPPGSPAQGAQRISVVRGNDPEGSSRKNCPRPNRLIHQSLRHQASRSKTGNERRLGGTIHRWLEAAQKKIPPCRRARRCAQSTRLGADKTGEITRARRSSAQNGYGIADESSEASCARAGKLGGRRDTGTNGIHYPSTKRRNPRTRFERNHEPRRKRRYQRRNRPAKSSRC